MNRSRPMTTTKKSTKSTQVELSLEDQMNLISDTSKKIRFLASQGMSTADIYKFLKGKVTTKTGGEIRYQHVRNVMITPLTSK